MSRIIVFAGTTEGRNISEWLSDSKISHIVCVATEYGEQVLKENDYAKIHRGRMDEKEMKRFFLHHHPEYVIDATHPYADIVTSNIKSAIADINESVQNEKAQQQKQPQQIQHKKQIKYLRLERKTEDSISGEKGNCVYFADSKECEQALKNTTGNILLTTGSKELATFCENEDVKSRLFVRVLPGKESISLCENAGIRGKNIIAMQGPFSVMMNMAVIKQFDIAVLVTKQSGATGGFYEKIEAAKRLNIPVYIIGKPDGKRGKSFDEVCSIITGKSKQITISLIGCGMGYKDNLSVEALKALEQSQVVFGAKRLLEDIDVQKEQYPYYLVKDIIPFLLKDKRDAAILFSGDSGFYSGAKKMNEALVEEIEKGGLFAKVKIYPGISSISALAAQTGESWEDATILSVHGKGQPKLWKRQVIDSICSNKKTFLLLSGVSDLNAIGRMIMKEQLEKCRIIVGYQMGHHNEKILNLTAQQCIDLVEEGLYSIFIINDGIADKDFNNNVITPGVKDEEFIRGKVPMTKEEVRAVSICKLKLKKGAIVYDIGSGTGSIAVEIARLAGVDKVYAIEKNPEAIELIRQNIKKFNLKNVCLIEGEAPNVLKNLPTPTNVFVGGSSGKMKELLGTVKEKNPRAYVVANAVSYETINEFISIQNEFDTEDFEMISMSVTRTKQVGSYNMMNSENQIVICAFRFNN
ncbi:MAG: precorrin-6Y C5,15-methyltransferase (decarboxylating) subunit CbiT [Lachnospiraceae bacterium]|nr:precorrin-6Y C5,15-methyltransferase (decarboxylating) subunit CbiT [Lachnospiraceae bacterium]